MSGIAIKDVGSSLRDDNGSHLGLQNKDTETELPSGHDEYIHLDQLSHESLAKLKIKELPSYVQYVGKDWSSRNGSARQEAEEGLAPPDQHVHTHVDQSPREAMVKPKIKEVPSYLQYVGNNQSSYRALAEQKVKEELSPSDQQEYIYLDYDENNHVKLSQNRK